MKVLVVTPDGFGGHGGIALYNRNMLTALCAHPSAPDVTALPRVVPHAVEPLPPNLRWVTSGVGNKVRYASALAGAARKYGKFDLVICSHVHLMPLAYSVAAVSRAPLMLFIYGLEVWSPTSKPLSNYLLRKLDAFVSIRTLTTRLFRSWAKVDRAKDYLLENAIHLEKYGMAPRNPALVAKYGLAGKRVIMTTGRVEERFKGFDEVIEVLPRIAVEVPNVAYLVVGDGWDVPRLKEKARALGVSDKVVFSGMLAEAEKADHYRLADVFAMPGTGADFDRYPLRFVFLEAMACGVPVVGSRPEHEDEANGDGKLLARQVDPNNADEVARGILDVLHHPQVGVPRGLERFAFPSFQKRLHAIIDDVLAQPRSRGNAAARAEGERVAATSAAPEVP